MVVEPVVRLVDRAKDLKGNQIAKNIANKKKRESGEGGNELQPWQTLPVFLS